jgi:Rod binding domain-containing protein
MKIGPLHPSSTFALDSAAATQDVKTQAAEDKIKTGPVGAPGPIDPEKLRLAREFEQIFIRKMLSSLEKSGHNGGGASSSSSGDAYGSMVVSALAEAVSKGGGVGLAEMIARAASQPAATAPSSSTGTTNAIQAAIANATGAPSSASAATLGPAVARITVPENVRIDVTHPPTTSTYPRPAPTVILNGNHDIHDSFKDPNR